ncbi:CysS/YqeB C-terminal domain-containing protein [Bradyrhizobium monzae]
MGFRNLNKPGYFNQINTGIGAGSGEAVSKNADRIQALRAAYANTAPPQVISVISSEIESSSNIRVEVTDKGKVILVFGNRQETDTKVNELIEQRNEARARKDFTESDRLRGVLAQMGITLRDFKDPVTGEPKSEIVQ